MLAEGQSHLTLGEAVPLGYALVASVARSLDVRALAIKGPILALQGLREGGGSVDVDFLVDPRGYARLADRLVELGWQDIEPHDLPTVMRRHSATFRHPMWPCEIDLHHYFPGFLAEPQEVFGVLWSRKGSETVAAQEVYCPSPETHAMIAALHYLRDAKKTHTRYRLEALVHATRDWPASVRESLVPLSSATGAEVTLAPFLERVGVQPPSPARRPELADWVLRTESETTAALSWWVDLRRAPWQEKPLRLKRAAWPSDEQITRMVELTSPSRAELRSAKWARLRRGLSQLPQAVRESRNMRRGERCS